MEELLDYICGIVDFLLNAALSLVILAIVLGAALDSEHTYSEPILTIAPPANPAKEAAKSVAPKNRR